MILFSNNCPKCLILKKKLDELGIMYEVSDNMDEIIEAGFRTVPVLKVSGEYLDFGKAIKYINNTK